jgi:mannose-6-phosphate isomerase-like protein (cupin superfamily)
VGFSLINATRAKIERSDDPLSPSYRRRMDIRRVVTGQNAEGKSVFMSDEDVAGYRPTLLPGYEFHQIWGSDDRVPLPTDGTRPDAPLYFPPVAGFRFAFFTVAPASEQLEAGTDIAAALAEFEAMLPGMAEHIEPDNPGMHTTDTIDFGFVVSGEVVLELDDGAETVLRAGDTYIQNGTRHRWINRGDVPAVLVVSLVGAPRP